MELKRWGVKEARNFYTKYEQNRKATGIDDCGNTEIRKLIKLDKR